jgi:RNA polymerase sigma factor (sigma-70 family)
MTSALSYVSAAANGDRDAYRRLVDLNRNLVTSIAYASVRDVAASEEVAQDVFVQVWTSLRSLKSAESFLPWLRQLTRNRVQQFLRERHRRHRLAAEVAAVASSAETAETVLLRREREQRLQEAVDRLPDETREVVLLFYREGKSVAQVALLLDLSQAAVRKRLSRARETLRDALDADFATCADETAPREAFSAAVMAALPTAGPTAGASVAGGLLKLGLGKAALLGAGGAVLGGAFGLAGMLGGHRKAIAEALDDEERRTEKRARNYGLAILLPSVMFTLISTLLHQWRWVLACSYVYIALMFLLYGVYRPRLLRRRWARLLDKDRAAVNRIQEEKRRYIFGLVLGLSLSLATVIALTVWAFGH